MVKLNQPSTVNLVVIISWIIWWFYYLSRARDQSTTITFRPLVIRSYLWKNSLCQLQLQIIFVFEIRVNKMISFRYSYRIELERKHKLLRCHTTPKRLPSSNHHHIPFHHIRAESRGWLLDGHNGHLRRKFHLHCLARYSHNGLHILVGYILWLVRILAFLD